MECSCGGTMKTHEVVRQKKVVGEYAKCEYIDKDKKRRGCGRIYWYWRDLNEQDPHRT